nr:carbamoyltransferase HypF [Nitrosopumilus sp.]
NQLPYERHLTTMQKFTQCAECKKEYENVNDKRYFSQTNSCAVCGIQLSLHSKNKDVIINEPQKILYELLDAFSNGKIVAVKGIGGFLLMCDATYSKAIQTLRERKHRPKKPFAVLFPDVEMIKQYTHINEFEIQSLLSEAAPIVLLQAKEQSFSKLNMQGIAPGLSTIGAMIPYAPLLEWIVSACKSSLIATSGNLSGSCIVFQSEKKEELFQYADFILDHNREIVFPQDDSVVRFSKKSNTKIILRRARGLAPAIILKKKINISQTFFASGAMLKSAFAIQHNQKIYLSQFLSNLENYDAQQNYLHTIKQSEQLLQTSPEIILTDLHPDYPSTKIAEEISMQLNIPLKKIQHHEAHFAAIISEHDLFNCDEKVLGVIWDGAGLGSDGNIWGGEFFIYEKRKMERIHYLEPFTNIAGDKIAKEPRLAAYAICNQLKNAIKILQPKFSTQEWNYYQKIIAQPRLQNCSAGRYFDAAASLLNLVNINTYEGEASLALEQHAYHYLAENDFDISENYFSEDINQPIISMKNFFTKFIDDIDSEKSNAEIAARFHISLVVIIQKAAQGAGVKNIAFSGGVFQNAVLVDLIHLQLGKEYRILFHEQIAPNDECIALGQLMHYLNVEK